MRQNWMTAVVAAALLAATSVLAQDAARGAQLYMRLPSAPSCFSCHGPDPGASHNNILSAADAPLVLQKALTNVGAMGFLKSLLTPADVADVAAFLGSVNRAAGPLTLWPLTADFGALALGTVSPPQQLRFANSGSVAITISSPVVRGAGFSVENGCGTSLAAGASCALLVRYTAVAPSDDTGALSVITSVGGPPIVMALAGRSLAVGGGVLSWTGGPTDVALPPTAAGSSASVRVQLVNGGVQPATISATTLIGPGASHLRPSGCLGSLASSSTCELEITYSPRVAGPTEAVLQVRSDGANPAAVAVRGEAFAVAASSPPPAQPAGAGAAGRLFLGAMLVSVILLRRHRPGGGERRS